MCAPAGRRGKSAEIDRNPRDRPCSRGGKRERGGEGETLRRVIVARSSWEETAATSNDSSNIERVSRQTSPVKGT